jgi:predicted metal-binding membrane protein
MHLPLLERRDAIRQGLILGLLLALATLAWLATFAMSGAPLGTAMSHDHGGALDGWAAPSALGAFGLFLIAWVVMTAAMMLPTALPMVLSYNRLVQSRPGGAGRVALFVQGYLTVWAGFGVMAYSADLLVHAAVHSSQFLASHTGLISGGVLLLAGAYQFTPLKASCLRQCRSSLSFLMNAWRDGWGGAWWMGAHHGLYCVGCCWALMLVMFAVGMTQLGWMLGLALLMLVEKVARRGVLVGYSVGLLFLLVGLATLLVQGWPASTWAP